MNIHFHTNLDMAKPFISHFMGEYWSSLTVPPVGTTIEFPFPSGHQILTLEVKSITYQVDRTGRPTRSSIYLGIPSHDTRSIAEWEKWMKSRLGQE